MPTEILMPALSPTMEEGTLAKWLVKEGDTVASGDIMAEIETDKATMEFEAVDEGVIGKILVAEGTEGVKVNTPIAILLEDGPSLCLREGKAWQRFGLDDPMELLGDKATLNPGNTGARPKRRLPPTERRAIEILEAKDDWTKAEIRKAYKKLIKVLHPDMNGGDRSQEDQLQEVVWAWDQIKDSRNFR